MHADGIPILMRLINGKRFEPGPFNLGRYSPYIGTAAVLWVVFITVSLELSYNALTVLAQYMPSQHAHPPAAHVCCCRELIEQS